MKPEQSNIHGKPSARLAATLAFLTLLALPAGAQTVIPITNPSFETDVLADGAFTTTAPAGWTKTATSPGVSAGFWNPVDASLT